LLGWSLSMVSRFEAATERPDRATHQRYCALAPTEELRSGTAGRSTAQGVYQLLSEKYPAYPVARLFGDAAQPLPVWAELALLSSGKTSRPARES
jgi:muramidase (phage lysozyme)